jgi:hypothetical protein
LGTLVSGATEEPIKPPPTALAAACARAPAGFSFLGSFVGVTVVIFAGETVTFVLVLALTFALALAAENAVFADNFEEGDKGLFFIAAIVDLLLAFLLLLGVILVGFLDLAGDFSIDRFGVLFGDFNVLILSVDARVGVLAGELVFVGE